MSFLRLFDHMPGWLRCNRQELCRRDHLRKPAVYVVAGSAAGAAGSENCHASASVSAYDSNTLPARRCVSDLEHLILACILQNIVKGKL